MRSLRNSIQTVGALALSCILSLAAPAAASGPPRHAQTRTLQKNKHSRSDPGHPAAGHHASASSKQAAIQARHRAEGKKRRPSRTAQKPAPRPCLHDTVAISAKGAAPSEIVLTQCDGRPTHDAIEAVGRWIGLDAAGTDAAHRRSRHAANEQVRGLVARLQAIATAFPKHPINLHEACSKEPGREGHAHGRALDVEVGGVEPARVVEICRTLPDTACGQVSGAPFVHVEVRRAGSGHLYWLDNHPPTK